MIAPVTEQHMPIVVETGVRLQAPGRATDRNVGRFIRGQVVDAWQNARALRPFRPAEFGQSPASPTPAHILAVNELLQGLQRALLVLVRRMERQAASSVARPTSQNLQSVLTRKELAGRGTKGLERVWDYYFELFGQRQTRLANWLLAADRVGLDCYQAVYTGLGAARSIPTPPPFCYMDTGFTPATFRRGVVLTSLGRRKNPFPIIKLPYHRLVNPWSLGAVHHEVSHNIQSDLSLWHVVPRRIIAGLREAGLPRAVAATWARWHKEIWADLCGLLLAGPANVTSLMVVLAR